MAMQQAHFTVPTLSAAQEKTALSVFNDLFDSIEEVVPFNPSWKNGTGYLDGGVKSDSAVGLPKGRRVKFVDDMGRRCVLIGTEHGNIVLFKRYADPESGVIVINSPRNCGVEHGAQSAEMINAIISAW
jgi:hypothetical protein